MNIPQKNLVKETLSSPATLEKVRNWLHEKAGASLNAFSKFVCKTQHFFNTTGELQINECSESLKDLDKAGEIDLQSNLNYTPTTRTYTLKYLDGKVPEPIGVPEIVDEIKELRLVRAKSIEEKKTWNTLMRDEHYLGEFVPPGRKICYLIQSEYGILGGLCFTSPAKALADRESWIGWNETERKLQLDCVVNMARFLIRDNVKCHNLASKVLGMSVKTIIDDFYEEYKFRPLIAETFVDTEKYDGTCYKAAGWEEIGLTKGRGWNDRYNTNVLSKKKIFVKALDKDFRSKINISIIDNRPEWVLAGALNKTEILDNETWSTLEFSMSPLGHKDRVDRLIRSAMLLALAPQVSVLAAFHGHAADAKAWYRFIESKFEEVSFENILKGHEYTTYRRMMSEKTVLIIQDETSFNYTSKPQIEGLGSISKNQTESESKGFFLHSSLAITPEGTPLGFVNATCYTRPFKNQRKKGQLSAKERESYHWISHAQYINEIGKYMPDTKLITVCDRGADIALLLYEVYDMDYCNIVVRAKNDRRIPGEARKLFKILRNTEEAGTITIEVPRKSARPKLSGKEKVKKREARKANLRVAYRKVKISPPPERKGQDPIEITAIIAEEINPPKGQKAVKWNLLTTLKVESFEEAVEVIKIYVKRWPIEEFHRVLKSGCKVEQLNYANFDRIKRVLAIYMVISWRIMLLLNLGREIPDLEPEVVYNDLEIKILSQFFKKEKKRKLTNLREANVLISKLGGYLDRNGDTRPGYEDFGKGYSMLQLMCIGASLMLEMISSGSIDPSTYTHVPIAFFG